jgi:NTP pyrophosphatase (non-canonical NTP hydrolase)
MPLLDPELLDYIRTLSKTDPKSLSQKTLKACEEVGELAKVVLPWDNAFGTTHRFADKQKIAIEIADTLLCLLSIQHDLDVSDEDLNKIIWDKAQYWHQLQVRAGRGTENLPFEIHITVAATTDMTFPRIAFEETCKSLNVKPLALELKLPNSDKILLDYQTSSFHKGTNRSAYEETKRIVNGLKAKGFPVLREKIETVPWHPAAPELDLNKPASSEHQRSEGVLFQSTHAMPPGCYFETHFVVAVDEVGLRRLATIEKADANYVVRSSRNLGKETLPDGRFKVIVTGRSSTLPRTRFSARTLSTKMVLEQLGVEIVESMTEFAIYDTAVSHDDAWILGEAHGE